MFRSPEIILRVFFISLLRLLSLKFTKKYQGPIVVMRQHTSGMPALRTAWSCELGWVLVNQNAR